MNIFILIAAILLIALIRIVPPSGWKVIDGDTVERRKRRCRIQGYDAPEWDQPHGRQARQALASMLSGHWSFSITIGIDRYGRRLIRLWTIRGPIASRMILSGHGHATSLIGGILQIAPRIIRRGLWRQRGVIHPKAWRQYSLRTARLPSGVRSS